MTSPSVRTLLAAVGLVALAAAPLAKGRDDTNRSRSSVEGIIRSWDPGNRTFRVTDEGRTYLVRTTSRTVFVGEHRDRRLSAQQFWAAKRGGQKVDVIPEHALNSSTVVAFQVRLDD